jgi:hypothetical protein
MSYRVGRYCYYLGHKDKSEIRGRVELGVESIFEIPGCSRFTLGCRVQFLAQEHSAPYSKFLKSGLDSKSGGMCSGPHLKFMKSGVDSEFGWKSSGA